MTTIEQAVIEKLQALPLERQQELLDFADFLIQKTQATPDAGAEVKQPRSSSEELLAPQNLTEELRQNSMGRYAHLGITLKEEDLAEVRREMWANFPRDIKI